jgi:hypothetical protein
VAFSDILNFLFHQNYSFVGEVSASSEVKKNGRVIADPASAVEKN